jgi:hypothetical protein
MEIALGSFGQIVRSGSYQVAPRIVPGAPAIFTVVSATDKRTNAQGAGIDTLIPSNLTREVNICAGAATQQSIRTTVFRECISSLL